MIARVVMAVAAVGCGRIAFDPVGDGASARTCVQQWGAGTIAFATPQPIAELASSSHRANPSLAGGDTRLYFDDDESGSYQLWMASRADASSPWQGAAAVTSLQSSGGAGRIAFDTSDTLAVLTAYRGGVDENLWYTTHSPQTGTFGDIEQNEVSVVNEVSANVLDPELRDGGLHLYLATGGTAQELEVATRDTTSASFGTPTALPGLVSASAAGDPVLTTDELVVVFSSGATAPENDLYYATRPNISAKFGAPAAVPGVNLPDVNDGDGELSQDGCDLYFRSDRGGHDQLYVAHAQ